MYIDKWVIVIEKVNNLSDLFSKKFFTVFYTRPTRKIFLQFTIDICSMQ